MPMTRHRHAVAAILVAFVALFGAGGSFRPAAANENHPIVQRALRDLGTFQGDCWPWVKRVVHDATGRTMGFDYRQGFLEAGAIEVGAAEAAPGDIIQVARDDWTSPDADYPGLHTAIVITKNSDGTFDAIDSNQRWDGVVRLRPAYDPFAQAAANGLQVRIYRFPVGNSAAPGGVPSGTQTTFSPGDLARTNTPGDCLRLRAVPGGDIIQCVADRTLVTIIEGPARQLGIDWYRVSSPVGDGWMAGQFLVRERTPGATPSAQGPTKPIRQYRAVVPMAAND
ncbi:hypothetical protein [Tepidiforma sp.]|uniref:hypothetical protein n=1 Tax=Tepidiforma sp. TaxID=2682230 RepID=UPI002ADD9589|nr:hypothetical protein [Tepidiforma sp.]